MSQIPLIRAKPIFHTRCEVKWLKFIVELDVSKQFMWQGFKACTLSPQRSEECIAHEWGKFHLCMGNIIIAYKNVCTSVAELLTYTGQHVACFRSKMFPATCSPKICLVYRGLYRTLVEISKLLVIFTEAKKKNILMTGTSSWVKKNGIAMSIIIDLCSYKKYWVLL